MWLVGCYSALLTKSQSLLCSCGDIAMHCSVKMLFRESHILHSIATCPFNKCKRGRRRLLRGTTGSPDRETDVAMGAEDRLSTVSYPLDRPVFVDLQSGIRDCQIALKESVSWVNSFLIPYMYCNKRTHDHPPWVGSDHDRSWLGASTYTELSHICIARAYVNSSVSCWKLGVLSLVTSRIQCHFRTCTCHGTSMSVRSG